MSASSKVRMEINRWWMDGYTDMTEFITFLANAVSSDCLQFYDAVGWAAGRASGL